MAYFKCIIKKLVSVVAACMMAFYGIASYITANAFYESQGYCIYNYQTEKVTRYGLIVDLPIYDGNSGMTRAGLIDDRVPDTEVSVVQLASVGGTGFIIDNHLIATAAHCVYNQTSDTFVSNMRVDIYNENCTTILKTVYPKEAHIPVKYTAYGNEMYDYALLYVEEDLSEYGMFSLGVPMDSFMTSGATVTVSGFPQSTASDPGANCTKRYKADGQIVDMNGSIDKKNHRIQYTAFASSGDSGGPVYTTQTFNGKTYHTVIGIQTTRTFYADGSVGEHRFGTRVTSTLLVFYYNNEKIGSTVS
ncbi:MAG: serine protease [Oscillospiraceae bacterium]|nr:serine protease [Oscillospiraceae bacterium]